MGRAPSSGEYGPTGMPFVNVGMGPSERGIVIRKRTLNDRVEIGVSAAEKEIPADAALDGGLDALSAIGLGVDGELIGEVGLQNRSSAAAAAAE